MKRLMVKDFARWARKKHISNNKLINVSNEIKDGVYGVNLWGNTIKKRINFSGQGKSGSGRIIVCYDYVDKMFFIHGFAKKESSNLSSFTKKRLKNLSKVLLLLTIEDLKILIKEGELIEV